MKKILLLAIVGMLFACGQSKEDIIKSNLQGWAKENTTDPSSFKVIELTFVDSIPFKNNIEYRKEMFGKNKDFAQQQLDFAISSNPDDTTSISKYKQDINRNEMYIQGINDIAQNMGDKVNSAAAYKYQMKAKCKNNLNAEVTQDFIILVDPAKNMEIIQVASDPSKLIVNPKDFPGYIEMLDKVDAELN